MEAKFSIVQDHTDTFADSARLTVIGVGGGGGNAVETMVQNGVKGITFVCANTDRQALDRLSAPNKIQLGMLWPQWSGKTHDGHRSPSGCH